MLVHVRRSIGIAALAAVLIHGADFHRLRNADHDIIVLHAEEGAAEAVRALADAQLAARDKIVYLDRRVISLLAGVIVVYKALSPAVSIIRDP